MTDEQLDAKTLEELMRMKIDAINAFRTADWFEYLEEHAELLAIQDAIERKGSAK